MSDTTVVVLPSTIDGIKRLAKNIKRERGLTHHEALDQAARQAGFENIRHAQRVIQAAPATPRRNAIYLSAYWRQRDGAAGRETMCFELAITLGQMGTREQLRGARNLAGFKLEFSDHLEHEVDLETQGDARFALFAAARTLKFMAATGLSPAPRRIESQLWDRFAAMPNRDHTSCWMDRASGQGVFLSEPYGLMRNGVALGHDTRQPIRDWAAGEGVELVETDWEGLYAIGSSVPLMLCEDPELAHRLHQQLRTLPRASALGPAVTWNGASGGYEPFVSPERERAGTRRRGRPSPPPRGVERAGALPYGATRGGMTSRWRPARALPLQAHLTVGPLLAALCNSDLPKVAIRKLSEVRTDLDDWLQMEYPGDKMTAEQFHAAYYGEHREPIASPKAQLAAIDQVIGLLESGYANCAPRRQVVKRLRMARSRVAAAA